MIDVINFVLDYIDKYKAERQERLRLECLYYMTEGSKPLKPRQEHIGLLMSRELKR